ncbi:MAG: 50S ribosomal protein L6 [Candidatus Nanoarchaeia archaeon]|nr:50S ribosomal protein L6 [Candidatus Haiyanarchaeum thermophilum]MCW1303115.1 50S ribosomal protein L6 [Candidatus Haiyanarchaeum thermophilum]MCW1303780.1 50S ribosomal protein L6 [Candidatus Haiyanarchaeum thermophilum]MCW1306605.1 50S ribosomal protein L6 [Candidatus Haiyanarchaeum thermophilum]MCW1307017.1 50S ribosomal protein L6 [Candidatus Haiyanarchaeum thermophilum]
MLSYKLQIPEGVEVKYENGKIVVDGKLGRTEREFKLMKGIEISIEGKEFRISSEEENRKYKKLMKTVLAHVKNMITGVTQGFTYKLKICFSHFPMTVKVVGNEVIIENFMGQKQPRIAKIVGNTSVRVIGDEIIVFGIDKEAAGQTAANIEKATRIRGLDRRVFQDGIYIIEKCGKAT